jgi:hypothetical protein
VIVVDPHREYTDLAVEISSLEDLPEYFAHTEGRWKIAFHNDHLNNDFPILCNIIYSVANCHLLVDEADWFCTPLAIPSEFDRLVKYGRHRNLTLCCVSRRPSEIHRNITANSFRCFAFSIQEPRDVEYLKAFAGSDFTDSLPGLRVDPGPPVVCHGIYKNLEDRTQALVPVRLTPGPGGGTLTIENDGAGGRNIVPLRRRVSPPSSPAPITGSDPVEDEGEESNA